MKPNELATIRYFNREYTEILGILNKNVFNIDLSWPEARILLTMRTERLTTMNAVALFLNIDKSYTSRLINHLLRKKLVNKTISQQDHRSNVLNLTAQGIKLCKELDTKSDDQIEKLLSGLDVDQKQEFYKAVVTINQLLNGGK
ncbi:MarR family winged helix-turn-helix transcriptional regulator [Lentilactobacillus kisonensis]|uniref:Transcriptional regulator, MarR family n=1 Tax=Lentilactobacillus kisonensis F0435 TaxID=797516 RepID=H1LBX6_9LACO|nr:MarR family transcriptional regulator [Lentilactobacillus kisonensis]EHO54526.1 transcriptional regulator, MarR family [Lentilactobacillus kisonensis F0435]